MAFYQSLADYYDRVFPLNPNQLKFVKRTGPLKGTKILDIGCGTGNLTMALTNEGADVTGIDLDEQMITKAKAKSNLDFRILNMLHLESRFDPGTFDSITCFGNTLVHLNSPEDMENFFHQVKKILKPGGKFLLQILNYDHILKDHVKKLPLIENESIQFERIYQFKETKILFKTTLSDKEKNIKIESEIELFPIKKTLLTELLTKAGFSFFTFYGNFTGTPLEKTSLPLILKIS